MRGLARAAWWGGRRADGTPPAPDLIALFAAMNGGMPEYLHPSEEYVSEASGTLADTSQWRAQNDPGNQITFTGGKVTVPPHANQQVVRLILDKTIPAGTRVRVQWRRLGGTGQVQPRLMPTVQNVIGNTTTQTGWFSNDVVAGVDKTFLEFRIPGGAGDVEIDCVSIETIDMSTPLDIIVLAGQSNMVGASSGTPPDDGIDYPHPLLWAMSGSSQSGYGAVAGEIAGAVPPLQHRSANGGLGPGHAFGRWYAENVMEEGRRALLLCTALGGTSLVGEGAPWNPSGNSPTLYSAMIADAQAALALDPANRVACVYWCQGEADRGAVSGASYPAAFADLVSTTRADLGDPAIPFIISGINPYSLDNPETTAEMIGYQEGLAEGQPGGIAGVYYSGWSPAWGDGTKAIPDNIADTVHFGTDANRLRGVAAAQEFASKVTP